MLKRFFVITTLFSFYIFPASARANINQIELNNEKVGPPKEEINNFSQDNTNNLILEKTDNFNPKTKGNWFLNFLGFLVLSYALIEILDSNSSSSTTNNDGPEEELQGPQGIQGLQGLQGIIGKGQ